MSGTDKNRVFLRKISPFSKIALDTSCFVYEFDEVTPYINFTGLVFRKIELGEIKAITSAVTIIEIFIKPERLKNNKVIRSYENLLKRFPNLEIYPVDWNIGRVAARIRAKNSLKTPDAVQLALAVDQKVDAFITNDRKLRGFKETKVLVLQDYV